MGISHEYHSTHGRRRRSKAGTGLRLAGVIAAILLLSLAVTAILENGEKQSEGKAVEPPMRRLSRWNSSAPPGRQRGPIRSRRMTAA